MKISPLKGHSVRLTIVADEPKSPPCKGGVDATSTKWREATLPERTGWSLAP